MRLNTKTLLCNQVNVKEMRMLRCHWDKCVWAWYEKQHLCQADSRMRQTSLIQALLGAVRFIYQPSYAVQHGVYFQGTEYTKNIMEGGDQACSIPAKQRSVKCPVPSAVAWCTNIAGCSGHSLLRASFGNTQNIWASHRAEWRSEAHFMPSLILLEFPAVTVCLSKCL